MEFETLSNSDLLKAANAENSWTDEASQEFFRRAGIDGSDASTFSELGKSVEEVEPDELFELAKIRLGVKKMIVKYEIWQEDIEIYKPKSSYTADEIEAIYRKQPEYFQDYIAICDTLEEAEAAMPKPDCNMKDVHYRRYLLATVTGIDESVYDEDGELVSIDCIKMSFAGYEGSEAPSDDD